MWHHGSYIEVYKYNNFIIDCKPIDRVRFDNDHKCSYRLNVTDLRPDYLDNSIWELISMVDKGE